MEETDNSKGPDFLTYNAILASGGLSIIYYNILVSLLYIFTFTIFVFFFTKPYTSYKIGAIGFIVSNIFILSGLIDTTHKEYLIGLGLLFGIIGFFFYIKESR